MKMIRKEVRTLKEKGKLLKETPGVKSLEDFNWKDIMEELEKYAPILISSLKAAVTLNRQNDSVAIK